jgi:hypothetical protein
MFGNRPFYSANPSALSQGFSRQSTEPEPQSDLKLSSTERLNNQLDNDKESTDEIQNNRFKPCCDPGGRGFG